MTRARILADLGGTDLATQVELDAKEEYNDNVIQTNIALLAFKTAVNGSLAKYSLQDQVIDEYTDATGVDDGPSTNHVLTGGVYRGEVNVTPTNNANSSEIDDSDLVLKWTAVTSSGNLQFASTTSVEYLIVGGGGSGGYGNAGGGGAGGYLANNSAALSLTGGNAYTITVGAGGAAITGSGGNGNVGNPSIMSGTGITTLTSDGGGYGGVDANAGGSGGSGGGGGYSSGAGGTATGNGLGYAGGSGVPSAPAYAAGGGGGAYAVGVNGTASKAGDGGIGIQNDITGTDTWYAGGGGGAANNNTAASGNQSGTHGGNQGGGGKGSSSDQGTSTTYNDAEVNTGGGGGGQYNGTGNSGDGGSGIVVIRIPNPVSVDNLTLQSTDTTAEAVPTKADMVIRIEDTAGTASLDVSSGDIKAYVSRDSGADPDVTSDSWTQATLVDEGDWGDGTQRILVAHDVSLTAKNSGQAMCYKITTHNQSASLVTKIHATSIGWR